jgi:hypothetical protein
MLNLAMAAAVARERYADHLKQVERAELVKIATRNSAAQQDPRAGKDKSQVSRLAHLIVRFGRA